MKRKVRNHQDAKLVVVAPATVNEPTGHSTRKHAKKVAHDCLYTFRDVHRMVKEVKT